MSNLLDDWKRHCAISACVHTFASDEATPVSNEGKPIIGFGDFSGDILEATFLVRTRDEILRAYQGYASRSDITGNPDPVSIFTFMVKHRSGFVDIPLSVALRGFGIGAELPQFAELSVSKFIERNFDRNGSHQELRETLLSREAGRIRESANIVSSELNLEAIEVLSATDRYTWSEYQFFTAPGERGDRRRQAAFIYPVLAAYIPRRPALRLAVDTSKPLNEALQKSFGEDDQGRPRLSKGALKRLQGIKWSPGDIAVDRLAFALSEIPVDWLPSSKEEWDAFCDLTATVGFILQDATGMRLDQIYAGCGGKWVQFAERVAKAYTDDRPPEGMAESEIKSWLKSRPAPDRSREAMRNASLDAEDMIKTFATQVILPVAAYETRLSEVFIARLHIEHAYAIAASILAGGKGAPAIMDMSRHWHTQRERIDFDITGNEPEAQPVSVMENIPEDGWAPAILAPVIAPNGISITPLFSPSQLKDEGAPFGGAPERDKNGVAGLNHCVSTHANNCRREGYQIFSVREVNNAGGYTRLSTAEIRMITNDLKISEIQHRGYRNGLPAREAREAWEWFKRAVEAGEIPINFDGIRKFNTSNPGDRNNLEFMCGYDWRDEEKTLNALKAWHDYAGKKYRKMSLSDFCAEPEIVGLAEAVAPGYASRFSLKV